MLRRILAAALFAFSLPLAAQQPPKLEPLPEPPPPPPGAADQPEETPVRIRSGQDQVEEQLIDRSEEHTSELQSLTNLVCRLLLEKKKKKKMKVDPHTD